MTAHDPSMARGGWMRWFGFGGSARDAFDDVSRVDPPDEDAPEPDADQRRRLRTLGEITQFLMQHDLPVSPFTLEVAHDIVTGTNPPLSGLVARQVADGRPVTSSWLDDVVHGQTEEENGAEQIHALILRLEGTVEAFSVTASMARNATNDYNSALKAHVDGLVAIDTASTDGHGDMIEQLTALAGDMLSRTRKVARELSRSERETRTLQKQLADARAEAEIDHLTGLPNRRAFETRYGEEYVATRENREPLCVAFCDIDEFKRINDKHGHDAGDRVLRTVAQSLATISDEQCHVARHGGEEFVVLLRNKLIDEACAVIDEAREAIAARRLINRATDVPFGQITLSAGVADVHAYRDAHEALRAADDALLRAKESGRNLALKANLPDCPAD
ncbi:GGDEF domain-containing protein [Novosphingobium mangrovi (ex Huang et al. 2023)]|uniref:diguanylate cyclase n=1 Tax=Novosphingobium mangrovi (ex Huang et al. 2023) TaxID=2976432 RepID=A0ABT2I202_9SPHN|nr:GGDEF domain-containing protein [Novosphingobium mangrovi (ex Huang et al. 2023)]MCT2398824.1 GGDEF domain-containing protein [Novosphingobium mangrovi (ex Huang et al. 2023)]